MGRVAPLAAVAIALVASCAANTGVVPMGSDSYMVSKQGWIATESVGKLKADAFQEAGQYCQNQGRQLQLVTTNERAGVLGRSYPEIEVDFRCLVAGDPQLARPTMLPPPSVVIQREVRQ